MDWKRRTFAPLPDEEAARRAPLAEDAKLFEHDDASFIHRPEAAVKHPVRVGRESEPVSRIIGNMPDSELAVVVAPQTFQAPILIKRASESTKKKFFEFFTVPIRNAHTRAAYYRAIQQFLAWVERGGYQNLVDIEPITVAACIETV